MDEFAYNFTSGISIFGAAQNPWNPDSSPGSGSAIAVATGMALAALGSDPAAPFAYPRHSAAIIWFKPTRRVPLRPMFIFAPTVPGASPSTTVSR
jgi:aspartyl-tRNA(Asn)/glutamyl-tRNA(Gln) amidotransferase subunit A